jgi:hypothetical protein
VVVVHGIIMSLKVRLRRIKYTFCPRRLEETRAGKVGGLSVVRFSVTRSTVHGCHALYYLVITRPKISLYSFNYNSLSFSFCTIYFLKQNIILLH